MQNLVFTQLSISEVRQLFREELEEYFIRNPLIPEPEQPDNDQLLTRKESAQLLSCSISTIDNYRRSGLLKQHKVGMEEGGVRFRKADLLAVTESKKRN